MSRAGRAAARERFDIARYAERFAAMLNELGAADPRAWPADRPVAFSAADSGGSGSVPPQGARRLAAVLESLAGRSILVHGTGQHTVQLASVLAQSRARIVGFTDDDPAKAGTTLWGWPVWCPGDAAKTGASDVVISSWMHERAIWERRSVYTAHGLGVHRVYGK
jgi:hypothetical protein